MKIIAVVKFNNREAFVFDEIPDTIYTNIHHEYYRN